MPVLHIGDVEIVARAQQLTSPALHIKNAAGEIYHVAVMPLGGGVFDATETLVYEENTINTCQTITLPAGIYRAELRGGTGGRPYRCQTGTGLTRVLGDVVSSVFRLSTETTVYSFRGGDGNDSGIAHNRQVSGGGASGVDSMLVFNNQIVRSGGGFGTRCYNNVVNGIPSGGLSLGSCCAGGGGGVVLDAKNNDGGDGFSNVANGGYCSGGGGGASASGGGDGGADGGTTYSYLLPGVDASASGGGNGGDIENQQGNSETLNYATGGVGGKNVYYSCGGQVTVSYGGGGGGGVCILRREGKCVSDGSWCGTDCFNGGDGGSGSTGASDDSYVRIYKIG